MENRFTRNLLDNLAKGRGVRLGEAAVVSYQLHGNNLNSPGLINIYTDIDAGHFYMHAKEKVRYLHMDIFYQPGELNVHFLAFRLWEKIKEYMEAHRETMKLEFTTDEWKELAVNLSQRIYLATGQGEGSLYMLAGNKVNKPTIAINSHIHFLIDIPKPLYGLILEMAKTTEKALLCQNLEIRKVEGIVHCQRKDALLENPSEETSGAGAVAIPLPDFLQKYLKRNGQRSNALYMAGKTGSMRELKELLNYLTPAKNPLLWKMAKKNTDLPFIIQELVERDLAQKGKLFVTLTEEGRLLKEILTDEEKEVFSLIKKSLRKCPPTSHHTNNQTGWRAKKENSVHRRKVTAPKNQADLKHIALPESLINSVARRSIRGEITLCDEDIRVYAKKSKVPVDICLLLDCSNSMIGEKLRTVRYLAENLLLSGRDKISVVTFQYMEAKVAVPFTKRYEKLLEGLYNIKPGGLTPMADGIMKSIGEIKRSRAKNPLLVLITDGVPNYPLWGYDGVEDALKAAQNLAKEKIKFFCIGVTPNRDFLESLAERGKGELKIIEDLHRQELLRAVHQARQDFRASAYK